ncbi:MAG: metal-dependent hydrolase [Parvularcula sp.]|nr:metal-dependent hydrolase [Parvularcula sp.]
MNRNISARALVFVSALLFCGAAAAKSRYDGPVIDMHLHAYEEEIPAALCVPWITQFPAWDTREAWNDIWIKAMVEPPCDDPIPPVSPADDALLKATIAAMEERHVIGVLSGAPDETRRWRDAAPERFLPSLEFRIGRDNQTPEEIRSLLESGDFVALGEISNQYAGIAPDDERMAPFWALAEELDIPVAIHMGDGTVGTAYLAFPGAGDYRAALSNPYLLEEVLIRHPRLRVSVMHYGAPLVDEMIAMLAAHPQVYIDIGGMQWYYPRAFFYEHLRKFVDAGFGKRIMFGSDQGEWPGVIGPAIDIIDEAPFLTKEQKADIFYNNAARFLRLSDEEIEAHREMAE